VGYRPHVDRLPDPRPDAGNPVDRDVSDVAGTSGFRRWELNIRSEVGVGQTLQQGRCAPLSDSCRPVNDEILDQAPIVVGPCLERQSDAIVITDIVYFAAFRQMAGDDLVTVEADPDDRDLGLPSESNVTRWASAEDLSTTRTFSGIVVIPKDIGGIALDSSPSQRGLVLVLGVGRPPDRLSLAMRRGQGPPMSGEHTNAQ
jgi:hypothetical protein